MEYKLFKKNRKSHIGMREIYFWTATIHKWIHLLKPDEMKDLIVGSLDNIAKQLCMNMHILIINWNFPKLRSFSY